MVEKVATAFRPGPRVHYSEPVAEAIVEAVAAGGSVAAACRAAGMPHRTTVRQWAEAHPEFEGALQLARDSARLAKRRRDLALASRARDPRGLWSTYTPEVGAEICERLARGRTLREICREPWAPHISTVFNWLRAHPDFADDYVRARGFAVDVLVDESLEIGRAATPATAAVARRAWRTVWGRISRISPRKYRERTALVRSAAETLDPPD